MTTRRIFILRHGKAQSDNGHGDRERPLSPQGRADMAALAMKIKNDTLIPDRVFCSPARRTRETLQLALPDFPAQNISFPDKAYNSSAQTLRDIARSAPDESQSIMIIAHNPGIHEFAVSLADEKDVLADNLIAAYEPGTLTVIEVNAERWLDLPQGSGAIVTLLVP